MARTNDPATKEKKLAAKLRENLKRRKVQIRKRSGAAPSQQSQNAPKSG